MQKLGDRRWMWRLMLASATVVSSGANAQSLPMPSLIRDASKCATCSVEWKDDVVLELPSTLNSGRVERVVLDGRGRLLVFRAADVPLRFARDGSFIGSIGRLGRGPGEMVQPYDAIAPSRDTLVILDGDGRRAIILDGRDRPVRELYMPFEPHDPVILRWPDRVLASGSLLTPEGAGRPLHVLSFASRQVTVSRSLSTGDDVLRPGGPPLMWHEQSRGKKGTHWAAWRHGYMLTRWSEVPSPMSRLDRTVAWFDERAAPGLGNHSTPPATEIVHLHVADDGLLWVYFRRAAKDWQRAWINVPRGHPEVPVRSIDLERLFEYHLEILDPDARQLVMSVAISGVVVTGLDDGRLVDGRERDDGGYSLRIRKPILQRPRTSFRTTTAMPVLRHRVIQCAAGRIMRRHPSSRMHTVACYRRLHGRR